MARDDRIGNAGQSAMPEMHIGAADFRPRGAEKRGARWQNGSREFADLDRLSRRRHHRRKDSSGHLSYIVDSVGNEDADYADLAD